MTAPRWLDDDEMRTWLSLVQLVSLLPQALDKQLRDDAGIGHVYYQVLALLSARPEGVRMSELARYSATSPSRLSHAVSSLEDRGWVRRLPDPQDRRGQVASLTDAGRGVLERTAPGHVAEVRRLVLDPLTPDEVRLLGRLADRLLVGLVPPGDRLPARDG